MNRTLQSNETSQFKRLASASVRAGIVAFLLLIPHVAMADVSEVENFDFDIESGGELSLANVNGDIRVTGVPGTRIQIKAIKKADNQDYLDGIKIRVNATSDRVSVKTELPKSRSSWFGGDSGSVSYEVSVPSDIHLDSIDTVNGDIEISGVLGDVKADTTNGDINLSGLTASLEVDTVNGGIDASFDVLDGNQKVVAETVNGRIQLRLPSDCSAEVDAGTVNGGIDADDFGLEVEKAFLGRDLEGNIGGGDARVKVRTVNGSIKLRKS